MKELQPLNEHVLLDITEEKEEQKTASGIIIPESAKEKKKIAKIVAISSIENSAVTVGDTILYKEYSGTEAEIEGNNILLIPYADILAKIVETEAI